MSGGIDDRHGQVFIAPHPQPDWEGSFTAYWDNEEPDKSEPPRVLEQGPVFADVEEAIAWGRERALRVLVRLGDDSSSLYSAGEFQLHHGPCGSGPGVPAWPPLGGHS
jgi:hypothetical protein